MSTAEVAFKGRCGFQSLVTQYDVGFQQLTTATTRVGSRSKQPLRVRGMCVRVREGKIAKWGREEGGQLTYVHTEITTTIQPALQ